jgi:hypothetical protein
VPPPAESQQGACAVRCNPNGRKVNAADDPPSAAAGLRRCLTSTANADISFATTVPRLATLLVMRRQGACHRWNGRTGREEPQKAIRSGTVLVCGALVFFAFSAGITIIASESGACHFDNVLQGRTSRNLAGEIRIVRQAGRTVVDFSPLKNEFEIVCFTDMYVPGEPYYPERAILPVQLIGSRPCWDNDDGWQTVYVRGAHSRIAWFRLNTSGYLMGRGVADRSDGGAAKCAPIGNAKASCARPSDSTTKSCSLRFESGD